MERGTDENSELPEKNILKVSPLFLVHQSLAICFGVLILCVISSWFIIMMNPWMWCILLTFGI